MICNIDDILKLRPGDKVKWPEFSGVEEILEVKKITNTHLIFKTTNSSLGAEVPLSALINYPKVPLFKAKTVVDAPMYRIEEVQDGKTKE